MSRPVLTAAVLAIALSRPLMLRADVVLDWNAIAVSTLMAQGQNPFAQARYMAITQLAVFEAVNAITDEYEPYLGTVTSPVGAAPEAAAIAAAYTVLKLYFPAAANLDADYAASLAVIPDGPGKTGGIATGVSAATQMVDRRAGDGAAPPTFYLPQSTDLGVWQLTPGCPAAGGVSFQWQHITPFGVPTTPTGPPWVDAFRPAPPPDLTSSRYARDFAEVRAVGGISSAERPADRTVVARFYASASPAYVFNSVARQVAQARRASLAENARMLALLNMASSDALVASFATKYHYLLWRPETAIRLGESDGNDKTAGDSSFAPFILTPCFPGYPSNHASGSNSAAEVVRRAYGARGHEITLTHPAVPGVTLRYHSLQEITADIDDARVYGGIHFRFDQDAGGKMGRDIARYVYMHNLKPRHGPDR
jgi:hypothetical protein